MSILPTTVRRHSLAGRFTDWWRSCGGRSNEVKELGCCSASNGKWPAYEQSHSIDAWVLPGKWPDGSLQPGIEGADILQMPGA
jgi:hypothetical protein